MRWTKEQYESYQNRRELQGSKLKLTVQHEPVEKKAGTNQVSRRITVRITSYRTRLLDIDNLYGGAKHLVDGLRYSGLIPGDRPQDITLEVCQVKVCKSEERTEIEIG